MDDHSCYFVLFTAILAAIGLAIAFFQSKTSLGRRITDKGKARFPSPFK